MRCLKDSPQQHAETKRVPWIRKKRSVGQRTAKSRKRKKEEKKGVDWSDASWFSLSPSCLFKGKGLNNNDNNEKALSY